jgi:voltage-gated sodium channel
MMVRPESLKSTVLTGFRGRCAQLVESRDFVRLITILIIINAITLGMETDDNIKAAYGVWLDLFEAGVLVMFVFELMLKIFAYGPAFFRVGWNVFDVIVVGFALVPASGPFAILRTLRILRVLRLMSVVPSMRRIITALFRAIPGMGAIISVLLLIYYVAAVLATEVFGHHGDPELQALFGSIGASMYTLFQLMTLEGWADNIAAPTIQYFPWAWIYFVLFIVITSFSVLNLFIGIIVDAMNSVHEDEARSEKDAFEKSVHDDSDKLSVKMDQMQRDLNELKLLIREIKA